MNIKNDQQWDSLIQNALRILFLTLYKGEHFLFSDL